MPNRPHIEFVQAQMLPWRRLGPGLARTDAEYKLLSHDVATGACSVLMRYPPGWTREGPEHLGAAEEFYVLDGGLEVDGRVYAADCYAFLPAGWTRHHMASPAGCVLLAFFDAEPVLHAGAGDGRAEADPAAVPFQNVLHMAWDMTLNDPKLRHLGIGRKDLRRDPVTGERTFLSLILPQSEPPGRRGPTERHPVVEEAYVVAGSLTGPHGTMHPGAYFWRPPGIAHGPFGSRWGAVSLVRFVGGRHVNLWSTDEAPFAFDAPYAPVLPPDLAHLALVPYVAAAAW
ncbi:cupin domain-containing protein [Polymorphobacter sp.]|uniref:cupin domain-containing protein n=1 Tax=Polymorphobacter sp. TaxID=1909290 RepID=UPI003F6FC6E8